MQNKKLTESVYYVGADDKTLDLFEGQYVIPEGISYNSYVIMDDKIAVMDTVDKRATDEWFQNLEEVLNGKEPDYLVILHMEPDHAANIEHFLNRYKKAKVVSNPKTFNMIPQFFEHLDLEGRKVVVNEGDELSLGSHTLTFVMAPMVHWPEVMVAYEKKEKILFSADAFGKFGALDVEDEWDCEARRYYINIVGKYGAQVQALLKKAATLDIQKIFALHGPMLTENLGYYINKYDNLKIESVNDTDKSLFKEDGTLLNKIKINDFEEDVTSVISKSNFGLNEHFNKFDIDENTSAYIKGEYLFIYKRNEPIDSNYVSYRGLISYTLLDNANKIQLTEYYLICDKISKICYDSNNEEKNTYITYSEDLNVSTMIDKLKKYVHTFEKKGEKYKWISVEGL